MFDSTVIDCEFVATKIEGTAKPLLIVDNFFSQAQKLRREFDLRMDTRRAVSADRFVWDYWHVPEQYTLLRTPAEKFFTPNVFEKFQEKLLMFAKDRLGCVGITPLWLSCYVEGCRQGWHSDVPHGPFAFVYSLTAPGPRKFSGGETWVLKDTATNFWQFFHQKNGIEERDLIRKVPSKFNRLVIFDPRIPHSVSPLHGTNDPREGRLVIHGWFTHPQPFIEGTMTQAQGKKALEHLYLDLMPLLKKQRRLHGILTLRLSITPSGKVSNIVTLVNNLRSLEGKQIQTKRFEAQIRQVVSHFQFPNCRGSSSLVIPLVLV